ncbi:TIM barrel protein [Sulfitobacter pseudonitzschiae]|uniref:TIM barrel protein n=1 Tax=Pseudosulfitobacter pseudonitzschiae TaxID=1402135 RepID=A0A9Q2NK31_9RHOB|nr:TIM barrel protein [Pseudosulfitobacter pseudonitzschiae]MBM2293498.1 TIM barrel protein [Pseudosulfitobacter pseudonitzschiae]MBM2298312.1 TIM barrel protein [Pseudosulfitobacter pseudonitzschiae]MBM2303225.1 TIM barrel protein [Pseudosulfitobacter pseudonitzschiae]MBM2313009.1 TIM barrel protein [Pseudosulfitobacter pseudonitzschiae]MBM2317922.1 TIM barrel protein [Pseudosulfitobacter pseudonitzschiae]
MRFSANLGFLWTELTLPDAIRAAASAGFQAVECHWPYDVPADDVAVALRETGLPMLGLNTRRGAAGENGLSALPGRGADARAAVDEALAYAAATDTGAVHVMAGFAEGPAAHAAFVETLRYACDRADGRTILIEPLNHYDAPGYFLRTTTQAEAILAEVGAANLKLMFDCYHVQLMEGDVTHRLERLLGLIGHVQVASVPDRGAPDHGELNYPHVWEVLARLGWDTPVGAEYRPVGPTEATLGWM